MSNDRDDFIERVARELRMMPVSDPAARARVIAAVERVPRRGRLAAMWEWLTTPRAVRVSPLGGIALAVAAAAAIAVVGLGERPVTRAAGSPSRAVAAGPADTVHLVQFMLVAPTASRVAVVGDFNGWDVHATPLRESAGRGVWVAEVPLTPGRHTYAFVVDDSTWMADPVAARAPGDDFGTPSSVIVVEGGAT